MKKRLSVLDSEGIGIRIQKLIIENGYTVKEVADAIFVNRQAVYKWLTVPEATPSLQHIYDLSELFGVSIDYIIKGK